jgi:ribonuclease-3
LKPSLLADALEALIAALYIDGGMEPARAFVMKCVWSDALAVAAEHGNYKGELWERAGAEKLPNPEYVVIGREGPAHLPRFRVEVRVGSYTAQGEGLTKKEAAQEAARAVLQTMDEARVPAE